MAVFGDQHQYKHVKDVLAIPAQLTQKILRAVVSA